MPSRHSWNATARNDPAVDLILWRHAEAHPLREGQSDLERRLTAQGERQARRMALWLEQRLPSSTLVLVSPALRCQGTVRALEGRTPRTLATLGPEGGADALLAAVQWPDAAAPVLVVGHQPTLGQVAARLLGAAGQPWSVKKAGVWWLRSRRRDGQLQTVLHGAMVPELL